MAISIMYGFVQIQLDGDIEGRVHIQIPMAGRVGLILRSTTMATASHSTIEGTFEGTLTLLWQKTEKLLRMQ